jgi:signal transduction histidine kinase
MIPDFDPPVSVSAGDSELLADIAADAGWNRRVLQAAAAREPLSRMTLGIAHEVNNLIGGISALSEIYLQGMEASLPIKDGLKLIHGSAARLQTLIRHLVELNRPPDGERAYVNLVECVRHQLELYSHILPKGARIETQLPDEEMVVRLDETAFRLLLLNLVVNLHEAVGKPVSEDGICPIALRLRALPDAAKAELVIAPQTAGKKAEASTPDAGSLEKQRQDVRLRLIDACATLREIGGEIEVRSGGEVAVILPLVIF